MGTGTNAARALGDVAGADAIDNMKDQLIVALLKRSGPVVHMPVAEIDATGDSVVHLQLVGTDFVFTVTRKH